MGPRAGLSTILILGSVVLLFAIVVGQSMGNRVLTQIASRPGDISATPIPTPSSSAGDDFGAGAPLWKRSASRPIPASPIRASRRSPQSHPPRRPRPSPRRRRRTTPRRTIGRHTPRRRSRSRSSRPVPTSRRRPTARRPPRPRPQPAAVPWRAAHTRRSPAAPTQRSHHIRRSRRRRSVCPGGAEGIPTDVKCVEVCRTLIR